MGFFSNLFGGGLNNISYCAELLKIDEQLCDHIFEVCEIAGMKRRQISRIIKENFNQINLNSRDAGPMRKPVEISRLIQEFYVTELDQKN
jgi:hypothetical protein